MVCLDANVLLELLLPNRPHQVAVSDFIATLTEPTGISMLSIHLVMHFGRQAAIPDELLQQALSKHLLIGITPDDYAWALTHEQATDFEDALQIAAAVRSGCTRFITLDAALAKRYQSIVPTALIA